jgi:hypothetical protein
MDEQLVGQVVAKVLSEVIPEFKHDTSTTTPTTNYMHGATGIFGVLGANRDVFSTRVKPSGLLSVLPAFGVADTNPLVPYLTGFTDYSGDDPDGPCDTPPTAGEIKSCFLTAVFGRIPGKTDVIELDRVGKRINRGEFTDLRLVNDPLIDSNPFTPGTTVNDATRAFNRELLARLLTLGVYFEDRLSRMVYTGNPVNNTANAGYMEFPGLDILIGTGKVDAISNTSCPSLDSDIKDFNYGSVDAADPNIVRYLTYMYRYVSRIAATTSMNPVEWAFVMRETLFYEITAVWPCEYLTYRCASDVAGQHDLPTQAELTINAPDQVKMRDDMRNGNYLLVDGRKIRVILDDAIAEECGDEGEACFNANLEDGTFASDIYLVPLTVKGGRPVTYMEFFDYKAPNAAMSSLQDWNVKSGFWTDNGKFLWTVHQTIWCLEAYAKIEPRIRLLTPHLAGRLQNVMYSPLQHTRDPFADQPYFVDGGSTSRSAPTYYHEWSDR